MASYEITLKIEIADSSGINYGMSTTPSILDNTIKEAIEELGNGDIITVTGIKTGKITK